MTTEQPTSRAAERLAALIDLAQEHDDDFSYLEVEQLLAATRRPLVLREYPLAERRRRASEHQRA